MTVIRPNSVSGINSITVQSGNSLAVHKANGELIRTLTSSSGVSTFSTLSVGTATTDNSAAKSINIGLGASISQHNDNALTFGTNGDPRITIDASGNFNVGSAATIKAGGNATFSGIVTAASFIGDGSGLTGAGPTLTGSTNNTIVTVTGANAIQGESNLTFDGSALSYSNGGSERFNLAHTSGGVVSLKNPSNAALHFGTNDTERVRILSNGDVGINTSVINRADSGRPVVQFDYGGNDGSQGLEVRLSNSYLNGNAGTDNAAITYIGQNLGITNRENGVITFRNNNLEMIRLQANKKIGLGTDSASSPVQIYGNTGTNGVTDYQTLTLQTEDRSGNADTGAGIMFLGHDGSGGAFHGTIRCNKYNSTNGNRNSYMSFATRQNGQDIKQAIRIDHNQNTFFQCSDSSGSNGRIYTNGTNEGNHTTFEINQNTGSGCEMITFRNGGSQIGQITQSGSGVAYGTSSDYRLKENDIAISDGITRIKQLRPIRFNFKKDTNTGLESTVTLDGFFAHEVQPIVPESVKGEKDAVFTAEESGIGNDVEGGIKSQTLDQSRLVPLLTAALKEAITKIETLETKVAALEGG